MTTVFEKVFGVEPYKNIRTYAEYSKFSLDYKPLFRHKIAWIARSSVKKIKDQDLLAHIVNDSEVAKGVADLALSRINDKQVVIDTLRKNCRREKFEQKLEALLIAEVAATNDPARLAEIARTEGPYTGTNAVRFAAVDRINDLATLEAIALDVSMRYTPVRERAADRMALLGGKRADKLTHWTELVK